MTLHVPTRRLRFYLTAEEPCPYLPDRWERKVFAPLPYDDGARANDALTHTGFRRSQSVAYRPACAWCEACVPARLPVEAYAFSRSERRILERNGGLVRSLVEAEATPEQFDLLRRYLAARHPAGGMAGMGWLDYVIMVEETRVRTHLIEYRAEAEDGGPGELVAAILVDVLNDGLSLVYSFFDPDRAKASLGAFAILDHVRQARALNLPYVYLGYWVAGSDAMAYKGRFRPVELLRPEGWTAMTDAERTAAPPPLEPRREHLPLLPVRTSRRRYGS